MMRIQRIALAALFCSACVSAPAYRVSAGMGMLPNPDPRGGLIDPPILGPASTFLVSRGYVTAPVDGLGPILTMERRADTTADRISILESRHEGDPGGWITIEVAGSSYIVHGGKYTVIKPSPQVREDADSLIARLRPPEQ